MTTSVENPFKYLVEALNPDDPQQRFYNLSKLGDPRYGKQHLALSHLQLCSAVVEPSDMCLLVWLSERLPFSIRVLLESAVRNCDEFLVKSSDVENILNWKQTQSQNVEVPFRPARVILQDFTYVHPELARSVERFNMHRDKPLTIGAKINILLLETDSIRMNLMLWKLFFLGFSFSANLYCTMKEIPKHCDFMAPAKCETKQQMLRCFLYY